MSELSDTLAFHLRAAGISGFEREYRFDPVRKWRADRAFVEARLLVECDGGTWTPNSGHNSGSGKNRDCERDAEAVIAGWRVLRFTTNMVEDGRALAYVERALEGPGQANGVSRYSDMPA